MKYQCSEFEKHIIFIAKAFEFFINHFFEGRRAAVENNSVRARLREIVLEHVLIDPSNTIGPRGGRLSIN